MKLICLFIFSLLPFCGLFSQDQSLVFSNLTSDSINNIPTTLDYNSNKGKTEIYKDERIDKIASFVRAGEESVEGVKMDGYRVLIFFDMSKSVAEQQKAYFLAMYTSHKAYVDYLAPNYRVRVGNFRTELEAEKLKQELLPLFPTAIVISDKIQLPLLDPVNKNN